MFPFQLFLFSFAVLGPLHYFTEIPWLHKKGYFTTGKYDYMLLIALCCSTAVLYYINMSLGGGNKSIGNAVTTIGFTAFFGALAMITMQQTWQKVLAVVLIAASSLLFSHLDTVTMIFANFIPSIIHVYIFTGCFILYGALKHKSTTGILSLVVFVICTALIFMIDPSPTANRSLSMYVQSSYVNFAALNFDLINIFGLDSLQKTDPHLGNVIFTSNAGIIVMRLIAFSYTYHFLNWFSKTSIIKWHEVSKRGLAAILLLWLGSLALYWVNFSIGIQYLYFLSLLHVTLEFPLNHRTFIGIGEEVKKLAFR
jgi:hypothetical protein